MAEERGHFRKGMAHAFDMDITAEFLAQIETGKDQRSAGVFLFTKPEQIRRITDLRFDFLFAITEIIVGNDGYNDSGLITAGEFERVAVVVKLPLILPTHPVTPLAFGGLVPMRQARPFLCDPGQVRR